MNLSITRLFGRHSGPIFSRSNAAAFLNSNLGQGFLALSDQTLVSGGRFVTSVVVGRLCGQESLGLYTLGFTVVLTVLCLQDSLVSVPYTVYSSRVDETRRRQMAGSTFIHYLALSLLAVIGFALAAVLAQDAATFHRMAPVFAVLALGIPFLLLREFGRRLEFARRRTARVLILDAVVIAIQILALVWLSRNDHLGPASAHGAVALACIVGGGFWLAISGLRVIRPCRAFVAPDFRRNWRLGRWLFASQLVFLLERNTVTWLLAILIGVTATGAFAACTTIALLCNPFLLGIANVLEPQAAQAYVDGGPRGVWRLVVQWTALLVVVVTLFCGIVAVGGGWGLQVLYGEEYEAHASTVTIMALTILAGTFGLGADAGLRAVEQASAAFRATTVSMVITLASAVVLIPMLGVSGAAYALLFGAMVGSTIRLVALNRFVSSSPPMQAT